MNGESVFGWLKVALFLGAAFALYLFGKKFFDFFTVGAGYNNPAKRGVDDVVSTLTGRDETLGGWLAEKLDPKTRSLGGMFTRPTSPSSINLNEHFVGDLPIDPAAGSRLNPTFARIFFGDQ